MLRRQQSCLQDSIKLLTCLQVEEYAVCRSVSVPEEPAPRLVADRARRPSFYVNGGAHREEDSWWSTEEGGGGQAIRERDNSAAVACIAGYMAGYLKAAGATCASTGNPHQYHPHGHPAMGVGTHPHPHSHPHPGTPHPGLPSPFALATHGHPHAHPLEHGLAAAFPQGESSHVSFMVFMGSDCDAAAVTLE